MSNGTIQTIIGRIEKSKRTSPIAVFHKSTIDKSINTYDIDIQSRMLDAVFACTVKTQRMIKSKPKSLIGVYHSGDEMPSVQCELEESIR